MTGASARLTATLPRVALGQFPTPLEPAPRLSQALGGAPLWVKREDLSGLALGGNKPRQLEFLLGAALAEGANAVITTAAAQSNFCRACAAAGARLGLKVGLLLRGRPDAAVQGNLLLDKVFGAEIRFIDTEDPYDPRVPVLLDDFASDFKRCGLVDSSSPRRSWVLSRWRLRLRVASSAVDSLKTAMCSTRLAPPANTGTWATRPAR